MKEKGIVLSCDEKFAIVKVDKKDQCSKCGMCLFPKGASQVEIKAKNSLLAKPNDEVIIETERDGKFLGAVLVFFIPLVLIIGAVLIGYLALKSELWILILSVLFVVLWYTILAVIDRRLKRSFSFCPTIVEIYKQGEIDG